MNEGGWSKSAPPGKPKLLQRSWDAAYNNEPSLTKQEHEASLLQLRAMLTDEQRRRSDRVSQETKGFTMPIRLLLAREFLFPPISLFPSNAWDSRFDARVQEMMAG